MQGPCSPEINPPSDSKLHCVLYVCQGKSGLWSHLLTFQRVCEEQEENMSDGNSLSPLAGRSLENPL